MRAVGVLCGVGSLLYEARQAGFEIEGNMETRTPFLTTPEVWQQNFPGLPLEKEARFSYFEPDLILGHPPCNNHSSLGQVRGGKTAAEQDAKRLARSQNLGLLPFFTEQIRTLKPKMFALDNLPKMLEKAAPPAWWEAQLPGYKLTFLVIANYDYGTPQLRKRLWIIGTRGKRAFEFTPPKHRLVGPKTGWEAIHDLPWEPWENIPELAHVHRPPTEYPAGGYLTTDDPPKKVHSIDDLARLFLHLPPKNIWPYRTKSGRITGKMGRTRMSMTDKCRVLSGLETMHHPLTGWPLTPRERARIMDWPDDFKLWDGKRAFDRGFLMRLVLFTGKGVPSAFPRYLLPQLVKHLKRV